MGLLTINKQLVTHYYMYGKVHVHVLQWLYYYEDLKIYMYMMYM